MFGKLFASAFEGSMRGKSDALLVWFNMIAHSPSGVCDRTQQTIADETGLTLPRVTDAIAYLESPDPKSRSPDEDGRRIVRLDAHRDWGWRLVNHWKYHELRSAAEIKHQLQNRERQRRFKEKKKAERSGNGVTLPNVTPVSVSVSDSVLKGVQGEPSDNGRFEPPTQAEFKAFCEMRCMPENQGKACYAYYAARHWMDKNGHVMDWKWLVISWLTRSREEENKKSKIF